jgi:asparagine synthase (glutamine-hydrolysing)
MSAFVCVFHRDASPVSTVTLEPMMAALQHHGPDGSDALIRGGIALGFQHFRTLPEDKDGEQPILNATDNTAFMFDGRLDNREEIEKALELHRSPPLSDAELAQAAHRRWGDSAFPRLLGPFALLAADLSANRITLARDALGDRTLFYYLNQRRLVVASEPGAVVHHPAVTAQEHPARLAAFFNLEWPADGSSFFQAVNELLPGHCLAVSARTSRLTQYWRLRRSDEYRRWRPQAVQERYRELLDTAVACRLRSNSPVAISLSGGLDSTSIAALACRHRPISAYSFVFDTLPACDERDNIHSVADALGLEYHWLRGDDLYPLADPEFETVSTNSPDANPFGLLKSALYAAAAQRRHRVMLNGDAADLVLTGKLYYLRDAFACGQFSMACRDMVRELKAAARGNETARNVLRRLLPFNGIRQGRSHRLRDWLTPAASANLPPLQYSPLVPPQRFGGDRFDKAVSMFAARSECLDTRLSARAGVERRSPYRDRRLVEFIANLPQHHVFRPGLDKRLVRESMAGVLPAAVIQAPRSGLLYELFQRGLGEKRTFVSQLLQRPGAGWPEFVESRAVNDYLSGNTSSGVASTVVWLCLCYELWRRKAYTQPY